MQGSYSQEGDSNSQERTFDNRGHQVNQMEERMTDHQQVNPSNMHRPPMGRDVQKSDESRNNQRLGKAGSTTMLRNVNTNLRGNSHDLAGQESQMSDGNQGALHQMNPYDVMPGSAG